MSERAARSRPVRTKFVKMGADMTNGALQLRAQSVDLVGRLADDEHGRGHDFTVRRWGPRVRIADKRQIPGLDHFDSQFFEGPAAAEMQRLQTSALQAVRRQPIVRIFGSSFVGGRRGSRGPTVTVNMSKTGETWECSVASLRILASTPGSICDLAERDRGKGEPKHNRCNCSPEIGTGNAVHAAPRRGLGQRSQSPYFRCSLIGAS